MKIHVSIPIVNVLKCVGRSLIWWPLTMKELKERPNTLSRLWSCLADKAKDLSDWLGKRAKRSLKAFVGWGHGGDNDSENKNMAGGLNTHKYTNILLLKVQVLLKKHTFTFTHLHPTLLNWSFLFVFSSDICWQILKTQWTYLHVQYCWLSGRYWGGRYWCGIYWGGRY